MTVSIKSDGRILVPAQLRRSFGATPGEALVARVEDGRLIIERRADAVRRLQERFSVVSPGVSLVDELLAERRTEVGAEVQAIR